MKNTLLLFLLGVAFASCVEKSQPGTSQPTSLPITGTWKLLSGTIIEQGDTTVTDYTTDRSFIKIITDTHFAFFNHDLTKGKDSSAVFGAGSGTYVLKDSTYTEHLEYCSDRAWEGNDFTFTLSLKNDTLIQSGIEKIEKAGVNRLNIEKYVKWKQ